MPRLPTRLGSAEDRRFSFSVAKSLGEESVPDEAGPGERGASAPCLGGPSLTGQGTDAPARPSGTDSQPSGFSIRPHRMVLGAKRH